MATQLDGIGGTLPSSLLGGSQALAAGREMQGTLAGQTVQVKSDAASALQDSAEELSMVADQFKQSKLKDKKLSSGSDLTDRIRERIKKIQAVQEAQAFKDLVNSFQSKQPFNPDTILKQAQQFSDDVLEQYAALDFAAEHFEKLGDNNKAAQIRKAQQKIQETNPTLIQAGLNISEAAADMLVEHGIDSDVRTVRERYAEHIDSQSNIDHVRDDRSLKSTYRYLIDTYGAENLDRAIRGQLDLLATDLNCVTSSTSSNRLRAIIDDMKGLKIQSGVHDACCETEDRLERTYPDENVARYVLMESMLDLVEQQWVTEVDFNQLPDKMNLEKLEAHIFALTAITDIVRSIPEEAFTNDETRLNMLSAVSDSLDGKIEEEAEDDVHFSDDDEFFEAELTRDVLTVADFGSTSTGKS